MFSWELYIFMYILKLSVVFRILLKNIHMHSLNLLLFVSMLFWLMQTALVSAKSVILKRLELQILFVLSQQWGGGGDLEIFLSISSWSSSSWSFGNCALGHTLEV